MDLDVAPIRIARCADAPAMAQLSRDTIEAGLPWRWQAPAVLRLIESERHNAIVAEQDDTLQGFAIMSYNDHDAYLALLAVAPAARRGGLARRLLSWLLKTADVAGICAVTVDLREDNSAARRLYEDAGFAEQGRKEGGYYGRVNQITLKLVLRALPGAP